ncbi:MAG: NAD(P)-binding protein [Clostridia bacterium]|jgi:formate dehydrogenase major subunit|nr:NAD(P)-binding protein [Clostridia bacterium]
MTVRININDREVLAAPDQYILQAALENGIEIPHLCHDDRIKPYGACGMCVVEIEGNPKLQRACATKVADGLVIKTHTARTNAARKSALKLLVSDHRGDCRPPCALACPAQTDCQGYVGLIANGQYQEAVEVVKEKIPLPASIGRVCPHPCEEACRRQLVEEPIAIAALKTFVGELALQEGSLLPEMKEATGKEIAVVGAGPAGISAAFFLTKEGHQVTIYEAMPQAGGMLRYGIPEYRLPKDLLEAEIDLLRAMGVEIIYNTRIGRDITLEYLRKAYDADFLGVGAWQSTPLGCEGENIPGILGGIDFLREVTLNKQVDLGKKVLVVGGGNTAMDVARTAVRLGVEEVSVIYRRTRAEMPAEDIEIEEAEEEGVKFIYLTAPLEVLSDGKKAVGMRCQKMRLGAPDASGRRSPEPIPGEEITLAADTVIAAIGQAVNAKEIGVALSKRGTITVKEGTFETDLPGVFAGGDAATGPKIAIEAIAQGKHAAAVMDSYLNGQIIPHVVPPYCKQEDLTEADFADRTKAKRVKLSHQDPQTRKRDFSQVTYTMTEETAKKEASRCLECGCRDYFECQLLQYIHEYDIDTANRIGEKHKRQECDDHPFLERNSDKCILCGLCVRACDEVMGITALGLVDRGFDSIVKPEFGLPLNETDCIACGQCADVCPTGACMEKAAITKQVPVDLEETDSTCAFCGVGCSLILQTKGGKVYSALPDREAEEGLLCARGRFGLWHVNTEDRLTAPLLKEKSGLTEAGWSEALLTAVKRLQAVRAAYGKDAIAFAVSPRLTNEEAFMVKKIADKLETSLIGSFSHTAASGLKEILGYDASATSYEELHNADLALAVGNVAENHPIMGIKLKNFAARAKLVTVSGTKTRAEEWAALSANPTEGLDFFKGLIKGLLEQKAIDEAQAEKTTVGWPELKAAVSKANVSDSVGAVAKAYAAAKKPIIVIDEDSVTTETIQLLADLAVVGGKIGKPHRGLILVRSKNNTQGLIDLGIDKTAVELTKAIKDGQIKALVILGEDPAAVDAALMNKIKKLDFLLAGDITVTKTVQAADVVLPLVSFAETAGTYTRSDRKIQEVKPAIEPLTGLDNLAVLLETAALLGVDYADLQEVRAAIAAEVPVYGGMKAFDALEIDQAVFWPNSAAEPAGKQSLYSSGFATADGKAHLAVPAKGDAFGQKKVYDSIEISFADFVKGRDLKIG